MQSNDSKANHPTRKPKARERLLATASRLFFKRGYSEVGIDEIIRESETAKATFYNHFPSKSNLVEAWLANIHESAEQRYRKIVESDRQPMAKILDSFEDLEQHLIESDYRGCPYSNSCAVMDEESEGVRHQIELHKRSILEFYYRLTSQLDINESKAQQLAKQIFLLYSGATTEAQNLRELWPVHDARQTVEILCETNL